MIDASTKEADGRPTLSTGAAAPRLFEKNLSPEPDHLSLPSFSPCPCTRSPRQGRRVPQERRPLMCDSYFFHAKFIIDAGQPWRGREHHLPFCSDDGWKFCGEVEPYEISGVRRMAGSS